MDYAIRTQSGFTYEAYFTFLQQKECGLPTDSDYRARIPFDLTGSEVYLRIWGKDVDLRFGPLDQSIVAGDSVPAKVHVYLDAETDTPSLPTAYDLDFEFQRETLSLPVIKNALLAGKLRNTA